jgi:hypothetical protein
MRTPDEIPFLNSYLGGKKQKESNGMKKCIKNGYENSDLAVSRRRGRKEGSGWDTDTHQ